MQLPFVVTHISRPIEVPALLDSWVTDTPSVRMLFPQTNSLSYYFRKNITCLSGGLLRIGQVFTVSCKTVYQRVTTNSRCTTDIYFFNNRLLCSLDLKRHNFRDTLKHRLAFRTVSRAEQFSVANPTLNLVQQTVGVLRLGIGKRISFFT
jgi:hypothetical protein